MKEVNARLEKLEPKTHHSDGHGSNCIPTEAKLLHVGHKRSSPKTKSMTRESSLFGGRLCCYNFYALEYAMFKLKNIDQCSVRNKGTVDVLVISMA